MYNSEYSTEVSAFICYLELENNTVYNKIMLWHPLSW